MRVANDSYDTAKTSDTTARASKDDRASRQVVSNIQQLYYTRLTDYAREMRSIEKDYLDKEAEYGAQMQDQ